TISDNDPGSLMLCSTDTPKRADISQPFDVSTISVNRDGLIDNVKVSLFFDSGPAGGPVDQLKLVLRSPIGLEAKLLDPSEFIAPSLAGHVLGTTCSPSPNFIFDDLAPTTVYRGGPSPYVGSFKPQYGLSSFGRLSARGAWQLQFNTSTNRQENVLNCWCLTFDLPREGLRLTPESATARIFFPHILQAIVTSGGAPVRDQPVSFTVRGEHDEIRFETQEKSDFEGVAELSYYDLKPGLNFIEARATVNGALSIAKAQVTWVADWPPGTSLPRDNKCPINFSDPDGGVTLSTARDFRDDVLAKTQRGRKYTQLYYQFSTEAVQIMMFNPMLTLRSREIVERYQPLIRDMVNGKSVTLTDGDLAEIDGFMNAFAAKGSPELKEAVKVACHDLRDPEMHAEFGIAISAGPKRKSAHGNRLETIEQVGGLTILSGVVGMVFIAASRSRPKALRRNAGRVLVVLLSVTTVANSRQRSETGHEPKRDGLIPLAKDHLTNIPGKMPISFEPNQGQTDPRVRFIARGEDYSVYLTSTEVVLALATRKRGNALLRGEGIAHTPGDPFPQQASTSNCVLRMKLLGANPEPSIYGLDRLHSTSNYFIGDDPAKWRTGIPSFARIKYQDIYPGVDLLCYGDPDNFEYDFAITPGVDPNCIRLNFAGADKIEVDAAGDLVTSMPGGQVREHRPLVHQVIDGARRMIPSRYVLDEIDSLTGDSASAMRSWNVRFEVGPYDVSRDLIIDPALEFSTYLGGKGDDEGNAITLDSAGNAYVIGFTDSPNFPTANAAQRANGGGLQDAFVAKVDPSGTRLLYSTFIGGNGQDNGNAIAVDAAGNAYITGYTGSTNFPTLNAMQRNKSGQFNAFVAKMNPAGALVYSTHLGGSVGDFGSSIAVDAEGNAYVAGVTTSPNFPIVNALQSVRAGAADVFAAKLNPSGSSLVYSTFLGGAADDGCTSLAIDPQGNAYLTGVTSSPNFRTANPLQPAHGGGLFDAFVAKLNTTGTQLVYSTYLGGSGEDRGFRIAVDAQGNAFVTGDTDSANFPIARALQPVYGGGVDAFVAKLNPSGTGLTYSTYLGGSSIDGGTAIAVDPTGSACVTGFTGSTNFPTVASIQPAFGGGAFDCFVARLNAAGSSLDYSTYLGGRGTDSGFGVAAGASGDVYVMGITDSADFPTSTPYQPAFGGGSADVFIARIKSSGPALARAEIQGKNLLVFGGGFDVGSKILLNGQEQRTRNDELNPTGVLFGKKVGKLIAPGETVTLQVRNSDGTLSNQIRFTRQ
ncbi:MAG TPA: SBBP repeat-containing protein, partial [Blastocatellia bacterium]|nr:SBBP repeat-containing protein [Blastocatellia bacterium]